MKKTIALLSVALLLALSSCSKQTPEFVHNIPDDAVAVISVHPMQVYTKGDISSFKSVRQMVATEIWTKVLDNPLSSGLMLNEYSFAFVRMQEDNPQIGLICGMRDSDKFESLIKKVEPELSKAIKDEKAYKWLEIEGHAAMAWNEKQLVVLGSLDESDSGASHMTAMPGMFNRVREESITSMVDFKDFLGKMKDMNAWVSSDKVFDIVQEFAGDNMPDLPVELYHNYGQVYIDFAKGQMNITSESHFSEEVEKNIEQFLVMKPGLDEKMLDLAPGGNLLLALAVSADIEKAKEMVDRFAPPELDSISESVETATGMSVEEITNSINGDFTLSINGVEGESMIPVEIFLGIGVNGTELQEKLMENAKNMLPVEEEGNFFLINIQGNEIYCGIVNDVLVLTNTKNYKNSIGNNAYTKPLSNSAFSDYADGSMGLYVNLNLDEYPQMIQDILVQNAGTATLVERYATPFSQLGVSGGNYKNNMELITSRPSENSLYTLLKMTEPAE